MMQEHSVLDTSHTGESHSDARPSRASKLAGRRTSALIVVDPASIRAEAIRGLRTRIIAQHVREGRRGLAVCSVHQGSGCTFVAANLAIAVAQAGIKTILVDADLRHGGVGEIFDCPAERPGLADFLENGAIRYGQIVDQQVIPSLSVIPAGKLRANAQELLSTAKFEQLVSQLMREYELAIFNTPPANTCTDAQRVATVVGYSLIVARKHKSYLNDVKALTALLRADKSEVVGSVLNDY